MSFFKSLIKALTESALQTSGSYSNQRETSSQSTDHNFHYVGKVEGAKGVVDVHVRRIQDHYQNVFRIDGNLRTPAGQWRFEVDGHSGYGKLHDETIIYIDINERSLAITINPYDQQAPTYYFRRA
jgi:hypothetical protein